MRKILLLACFIIPSIAFSQSCPDFSPGSRIDRIAPGLYRLTVNFNANGQKHLDVSIFEGPTILANLLTTTCIPIHGPGSVSMNFVSTGNDPRATVVPGTGNCGGGSPCPQNAITVSYAAGGVLPVVIESFYAKRTGNKVSLTWKTLFEVNAKEFIIERNTGNGFMDFKTITASNNTTGSTYTITDINNNKGATLYRLKMSDLDGTYSTSETRSVKGMDSEAEYNVFPNPVSRTGKFAISDISEATDVFMIDNTGRMVKKITLNGNNNIELNNIPNGVYQIRIQPRSSKAVITRKITVIN